MKKSVWILISGLAVVIIILVVVLVIVEKNTGAVEDFFNKLSSPAKEPIIEEEIITEDILVIDEEEILEYSSTEQIKTCYHNAVVWKSEINGVIDYSYIDYCSDNQQCTILGEDVFCADITNTVVEVEEENIYVPGRKVAKSLEDVFGVELIVYYDLGWYEYYLNEPRYRTNWEEHYIMPNHDSYAPLLEKLDEQLIRNEFDGDSSAYYTTLDSIYSNPDNFIGIAYMMLGFAHEYLYYVYDGDISDASEYPKYPIETLIDESGDCEDSAILMANLLESYGYDTRLIQIYRKEDYEGHMALGVYCPEGFCTGAWLKEGDKKYYYVDSTSADEIGVVRPDMDFSTASFAE